MTCFGSPRVLCEGKKKTQVHYRSLTGVQGKITSAASLYDYKVLAVGTETGKIFLFDLDGDDEPIASTGKHTESITKIIHLVDDLIISIGTDGWIHSSHAMTYKESAALRFEDGMVPVAVEKLNEKTVAVGLVNAKRTKGEVIVLSYVAGRQDTTNRDPCFTVNEDKRFQCSQSAKVKEIEVRLSWIATGPESDLSNVWSELFRFSFARRRKLKSAAVTDKVVVAARKDGYLYVYSWNQKGKLHFEFKFNPTSDCCSRSDCCTRADCHPSADGRLKDGRISSIKILNDEYVALIDSTGTLRFISLSEKKCKESMEFSFELYHFIILSDAKIVVSGSNDFLATFNPPEEILHAVEDFVLAVYPESALDSSQKRPIRQAWYDVENGVIGLIDACRDVITEENCKRCFSEAIYAHYLLMKAREGISRHFDEKPGHWYAMLYTHFVTLTKSERDKKFVRSILRQAEDAKIIAEGSIENFIDNCRFQEDYDMQHRCIVRAIYKQFLRQAAMDVRLKEVLRYQNDQKLMALINAVLGFIPITGGMLTNAAFGGLAILNDFQVCGMVESLIGVLLGTGENIPRRGSDRMVDRFLMKAMQLLEEDEWEKLSTEEKTVIKDAALNLGFQSVDELREKLLQVSNHEGNPGMNVIAKEVGAIGGTLPDSIEEFIQNGTTACGSAVDAKRSEETIPQSPPALRTLTTLHLESALREMKMWEEKGRCNAVIVRMSREELAGALAAYLVNYEQAQARSFISLKESFMTHIQPDFMFGDTFAITAIAEVRSGMALVSLTHRLRKFLHEAYGFDNSLHS